MVKRTPLATIDEASLGGEGATAAFDYEDGLGRIHQGFVVRWRGELYAYCNRCPHWSTPLDEHGDELFDHASGVLVCQTHGARFKPDSGECVSGPCMGDSLQKLRVEVAEDGQIEIYRRGLAL